MIRPGASEAYNQLLEKVRWSHQHGRDVSHLNQADTDLARLFAYGYRSQTIGTFHATRTALARAVDAETDQNARWYVARAIGFLLQLENEAIQVVPQDFRAALSTLYRYEEWTNDVLQSLQTAILHSRSAELECIGGFLLTNLDGVVGGNGLYIATDTHTPQQGAFQVPNLNITIVPVIYGDFHSWNFARLKAEQSGVPVHRHRAGVEIHLGLSHVDGATILGNFEANVQEGYAMPIPPTVNHGFYNRSGYDHILPFVFGSFALGGWGIFFDVEPHPGFEVKRSATQLESADMNHSVWLERAIERIEKESNNVREIIIPAASTSTPKTGGLQLSAARIAEAGADIRCNSFRIVSVVRGKGKVRVGPAEIEVQKHDHFGVPANVATSMAQLGDEPLVVLDALLLPHPGEA